MPTSVNTKKIFLFAICIFAFHSSFSQTITFCESVDSTGTSKNTSTAFSIESVGGFVTVLVTMPAGVNSDFITYDVFRAFDDNTETYESTIKQTIQPEFTWFSKEITFHKTGRYNVYVYDGKDRLLCVGRVTIKIN